MLVISDMIKALHFMYDFSVITDFLKITLMGSNARRCKHVTWYDYVMLWFEPYIWPWLEPSNPLRGHFIILFGLISIQPCINRRRTLMFRIAMLSVKVTR